MSYWDLSSVILKLANLLSMSVVLGGSFSFALVSDVSSETRVAILRYVRVGAAVGATSTCLFFLVQVGGISQIGLLGTFDLQMGKIVADSGLGSSTALRLLGYFGILLVTIGLSVTAEKNSPWTGVSIYLTSLSYLFVVFLFSSSFPLTGHTADLGSVAHIAIAVHVVSASLWIGSLYPLRVVTLVTNQSFVKTVMEKFGQIAVYIVGSLLVSGIYLATQLLDSVKDLILTVYGNSFTLKLIGVIAILQLAASNKFFIVPKLVSESRTHHLRESISIEIFIGIFIVAITSYFTTVVGISHG